MNTAYRVDIIYLAIFILKGVKIVMRFFLFASKDGVKFARK